MPVQRGELETSRSLGTAGDAMTRDVASLASDLSLGIAARELERTGATGAPVVDSGRVVGVVTLSDLLSALPEPRSRPETAGPFHRMEHLLSRISAEKGLAVRDVMTMTFSSMQPSLPAIRRPHGRPDEPPPNSMT